MWYNFYPTTFCARISTRSSSLFLKSWRTRNELLLFEVHAGKRRYNYVLVLRRGRKSLFWDLYSEICLSRPFKIYFWDLICRCFNFVFVQNLNFRDSRDKSAVNSTPKEKPSYVRLVLTLTTNHTWLRFAYYNISTYKIWILEVDSIRRIESWEIYSRFKSSIFQQIYQTLRPCIVLSVVIFLYLLFHLLISTKKQSLFKKG